ncbi:hypothetical protein DPMN_117095 [Dreissena polymorpha]|uniref:Uncharacterized protein n=1 Tax=Dreissena polymorpha TaxID=45954 RepID=A0A9D4KQ51_DREPO|nr:hypothetical protein DPMN_117095 [Dreissena polymorpha]
MRERENTMTTIRQCDDDSATIRWRQCDNMYQTQLYIHVYLAYTSTKAVPKETTHVYHAYTRTRVTLPIREPYLHQYQRKQYLHVYHADTSTKVEVITIVHYAGPNMVNNAPESIDCLVKPCHSTSCAVLLDSRSTHVLHLTSAAVLGGNPFLAFALLQGGGGREQGKGTRLRASVGLCDLLKYMR